MTALTIFVTVALSLLVLLIARIAWRDHVDRRLSNRPGITGAPTHEESEATARAASQAVDSLHGETWAG